MKTRNGSEIHSFTKEYCKSYAIGKNSIVLKKLGISNEKMNSMIEIAITNKEEKRIFRYCLGYTDGKWHPFDSCATAAQLGYKDSCAGRAFLNRAYRHGTRALEDMYGIISKVNKCFYEMICENLETHVLLCEDEHSWDNAEYKDLHRFDAFRYAEEKIESITEEVMASYEEAEEEWKNDFYHGPYNQRTELLENLEGMRSDINRAIFKGIISNTEDRHLYDLADECYGLIYQDNVLGIWRNDSWCTYIWGLEKSSKEFVRRVVRAEVGRTYSRILTVYAEAFEEYFEMTPDNAVETYKALYSGIGNLDCISDTYPKKIRSGDDFDAFRFCLVMDHLYCSKNMSKFPKGFANAFESKFVTWVSWPSKAELKKFNSHVATKARELKNVVSASKNLLSETSIS